jgi:hypothetical protein
MNSTVTDLLLQRWVDGQVSRTEERELLADCDRHPGQWRRVALAFIEERAMGREFAAEFGADIRLLAKPASKPVAKPQPAIASASWLASRRVQQWCAIAASLLLGLFVGNSLNWNFPTGDSPTVATNQANPPRRGAFPNGGTSMVEYIPDQSRGERYRMPLLDERSVPAGYFDDDVELTGIPPEFERILREHGIEIRGHRDWKSYEIEEGQVIMIPTIRFDVRHGAATNP